MKTISPKQGVVCQLMIALCTITLIGSVIGCSRGRSSEDPPVHLVNNMDSQPRYEAQEASPFFEDGMASRPPIPGTVARDQLNSDTEFCTGYDSRGNLIKTIPIPLTTDLMKRGRERFNIYCAPCHGRVGNGQGMVVKRGMLAPPSFHDDRLRDTVDAHFFKVMTDGRGNMVSYRTQLTPRDRWAIVAYIRALQRSQNASLSDLQPGLITKEQEPADEN